MAPNFKVKKTRITLEVKRLSKIAMNTFTCPKCGWTIKTPFGEDDNADQIKLHNAKHHNEDDKVLRARISKSDLLRL
jgi:hypothetical protein